MRTIRLTLEYDGTDWAGWQRQANAPAIQEALEAALTQMCCEPITITGASRTDAGVHALGQVASFATSSTIPVHGFWRGLNQLLPKSIAVVDFEEVPAGFSARFDSVGKHYQYQVLARGYRSPLRARRSWHRFRALDVEAMKRGATPLFGEHDFSAFRAVGCAAKTPVRRIDDLKIRRVADLVTIDVRGNAFLRNMVRIIAGTLVEVGEGRRDPETVAAALASGDRTGVGVTAPAHGLTLVRVFYRPLAPAPAAVEPATR